MVFNKSNLYIESDFEVRIIRETEIDIDIIVPLLNRTLNLNLPGVSKGIRSRFQFPMVKYMIIRLTKAENNNIATIHLLRNIDIQSSIVNFEMDYENHIIELLDRTSFTEFKIKVKKERG